MAPLPVDGVVDISSKGIVIMRIFHLVRPVALAAVLLAVTVLPGLTSSAGAASRGGIVIHPRLCPFDLAPGDSLFEECHGTPGPDDVTFTVDSRREKAIDSRGNVSFGSVTAGDHLVILTTDYQPNEFLQLKAFCSNINPTTGTTGPNEATIRTTEQASFYVRVGSGSKLVCDVYFLRESGR